MITLAYAAQGVTDSWLSGLGLGLGVLGLLTGYIFYRLGRQPKTLDYEIDNTVEILSPTSKPVGPQLQVFWKTGNESKQLLSPRIVELRFVNTGKVAISRSDFADWPIVVQAPPGTTLIEVVAEEPKSQSIVGGEPFPVEDNAVRFTPSFMDPSEAFVLRVVLDGPSTGLDVRIRLAGETRPGRNSATPGAHPYRILLPLTLAAVLVGAASGAVLNLSGGSSVLTGAVIGAVLGFIVIMYGMVFVMAAQVVIIAGRSFFLLFIDRERARREFKRFPGSVMASLTAGPTRWEQRKSAKVKSRHVDETEKSGGPTN